MATRSDELIVEIKGDIKDLTKKLDQALDNTKKSTDGMGGAFSVLNNKIGKLAVGFGAFSLAVDGVNAAMTPFIKAMEKVNDVAGLKRTADLVGVNVERFQELSFAARSVGVDSETFADALKDLNVKITDAANGAASYEEALNLIGLQSKDLIGLSVDKQFEAFADAMSKANDQTRRFVADEINDSMFQLNTLLEKGARGLENYTNEARALGVVLSSKEMKEVVDLNMEFKKLTASSGALADKLVSKLSPALKAIIKVANESAEAVGGIFSEETEKKATNINEEIDKQKEKIKLLKIDLIQAEAAVIDFEDSMFKAFQPGQADLLNIEVQELNRKLKIANQELKDMQTARDNLGGFMTGPAPSDGTPVTAQGSVVGQPEDAEEQGTVIAPSKSVVDEELERLEMILHEKEVRELEAQRRALEQREAFNDAINNADKRAQDANLMLWQSGWRGKHQIVSQTLGQMGKLMNTESRKMFEVGKAAAIAQVAIDTPKAAMSAFSAMAGIPIVGPVLGAAAAAAAVATGFSQIQKIQSTQFGGGGGGSAGGIAAPVSEGQAEQPQEVVRQTDVSISLIGDNFGGDGVRGVFNQLNEFLDDGGKLNSITVNG